MDQPASSLLKSKAYIDGAWVGDPAVPVTDKASGEIIARVPQLGAKETRAAIAAAERAFAPWSQRPAKERAGILRDWYDLIVAHTEDLAELMTREQGKPLSEARGEVAYGASFVEFNAEQAKRIYGETIPSPNRDGRIIVIKQPIGVVGAITPWNFPIAMITRKVTPALAAGCTAVVKPAEDTPLCALALAALGEQAGIPRGVLNIITASDPEPVGRELCENASVKMITFTGSTEVGKMLMRQAAGTVKKVALELGGNAPFIVFEDADLDAAVSGAVASKFRNAGQTCVCANRIFVQSAIYDDFTKKLTEEVSPLKVGAGLEKDVAIGPLINADAVGKVETHVADAVAKGAQIVIGGRRHALGGNFYEPTVLRNVARGMRLMSEETFGPVAPLIKFETESDVIAMANDTTAGLAAYFYATDLARAWRVAEALDYGIVGINAGIVSSELAPFGGVKESGLGREGSHHGIEEFVEIKYIYLGGL